MFSVSEPSSNVNHNVEFFVSMQNAKNSTLLPKTEEDMPVGEKYLLSELDSLISDMNGVISKTILCVPYSKKNVIAKMSISLPTIGFVDPNMVFQLAFINQSDNREPLQIYAGATVDRCINIVSEELMRRRRTKKFKEKSVFDDKFQEKCIKNFVRTKTRIAKMRSAPLSQEQINNKVISLVNSECVPSSRTHRILSTAIREEEPTTAWDLLVGVENVIKMSPPKKQLISNLIAWEILSA